MYNDANVPSLCASQQMGSTTNYRFMSDFMRLKLRQLRLLDRVVSVDDDLNQLYNCQLVVSHGGSFLGAWSDELGCPTVYLKDVRFVEDEDQEADSSGSNPTPLSSPHIDHCTSTIMSNCQVVDICGVDIESGLHFVLFVANSIGQDSNHAQLIPRRYDPPISSDLLFGMDAVTRRFEFYNYLHCCAWNDFTKTFAIGGCGGIFMRSLKEWRLPFESTAQGAGHLKIPNTLSYSLQFNSIGNVLLCGFSDGTLATADMRNLSTVINMKTLSGNGITRMKLLSDDYSLITSGPNDKLSFVDIRMNSVVFNYPEHVNKQENIPFDIDESLNLICSPGQDNVTRFWNLKHGRLLSSLNPPEPDQCQVFASFNVKKHKICAYIFSKEKIYCYNSVNV